MKKIHLTIDTLHTSVVDNFWCNKYHSTECYISDTCKFSTAYILLFGYERGTFLYSVRHAIFQFHFNQVVDIENLKGVRICLRMTYLRKLFIKTHRSTMQACV